MLYKRVNISVAEFSDRLSKISSKHTLSDTAIADVLRLFEDVLPIRNSVPSLYKKRIIITPRVLSPCVEMAKRILLPFATNSIYFGKVSRN